MAKIPSKIPASKPRNPVVKNMSKTGTQVHKDKKRAEKQGDVKHKGRKDYAEHLKRLLVNQLSENYRLSEINTPRDAKGIQQKLAELNLEKETLEVAVNKARQITRGIKYEPPAHNIVSELKNLADKVNVDPRQFKYLEDEVFEAQRALEAAVYGLDDVFVELYRTISNQIEELENTLDDLSNQ
jgi:ATP-dependent protease HslVU (ClpYQ) ATPase subunit